MRSCQRLVIALLRVALDAGQFDLEIGRAELEDLLQHEEKRGWIVHVQTFQGKERFLRHAGRYGQASAHCAVAYSCHRRWICAVLV